MKAGRLLIILSLVLIGPTPAQAAPGNPSGTNEVPHQVTLITGDVVTFYENNSFTVDPAERPDGREVTFTGRTGKTVAGVRDFYVFPSDSLTDTRLDEELFNVRGLVREGLDHARTMRVMVDRKSVKVDHTEGRFVHTGSSKVWLDHRRKVALDESVRQIGAPNAWAAGHDGTGVTVAVIDTGIDAGHPDLADRVVAQQNFTEDPDAGDYHGHGTHVAATIAGQGERYRGVAPGAKLVNAKGCDGGGYCYDSWLIDAMNYAAHSGARVVNMSVGGGISDGTDPLSQEVNRLTEETGVLFVVAAGNAGEYGPVSVGAPGAAAAALTVGAVDRQDKLAYFSSRGPRYGDAGIKPDLTAPGVGIVSAQAGGGYVAMSGTSMATPHVAGAAAILAGQHVGWKAGRIKDALVSTARPTGGNVTDEGSGRVDITSAHRAVLTGSAAVDFGQLSRHSIRMRKVTYRNDGETAITLSLTLTAKGWNGKPLSRGAVILTPHVRVPAHGSGHALLLVNTFVGEPGSYAGIIEATATGVNLRTPMSYYLVPPTHTLTTSLIDHSGQRARPVTGIYLIRDDFDPVRNNDPFAQVMFDGTYLEDNTVTFELPTGTYTALTTLSERTLARRRWTALSLVDIPVSRGKTIELDARKAVPIRADGGDTDVRFHSVSFGRSVPGGAVITGCACVGAEAFATPTPAPKQGVLSLQDTWTFADRVARFGSFHPAYEPYAVSTKLPGRHTYPVVWAGDGSDFTGVDVAGKVALIGIQVGTADPSTRRTPLVRRQRNALRRPVRRRW